jgi:hypothetical protein
MEPATSRLVTECLNQIRNVVPPFFCGLYCNSLSREHTASNERAVGSEETGNELEGSGRGLLWVLYRYLHQETEENHEIESTVLLDSQPTDYEMEPEGSVLCPQESATGFYPSPQNQSLLRSIFNANSSTTGGS